LQIDVLYFHVLQISCPAFSVNPRNLRENWQNTLSQQLCTKCPHFCTHWYVRSTHPHKCVQKMCTKGVNINVYSFGTHFCVAFVHIYLEMLHIFMGHIISPLIPSPQPDSENLRWGDQWANNMPHKNMQLHVNVYVFFLHMCAWPQHLRFCSVEKHVHSLRVVLKKAFVGSHSFFPMSDGDIIEILNRYIQGGPIKVSHFCVITNSYLKPIN